MKIYHFLIIKIVIYRFNIDRMKNNNSRLLFCFSKIGENAWQLGEMDLGAVVVMGLGLVIFFRLKDLFPPKV